MTEFCLIILDKGSSEERAAIHALVKEHASGWWHHFGDAWVAGGKKATEWRNLLNEARDSGSGSALLVMKLPESGKRAWAYSGPNGTKRTHWLKRKYTDTNR